MWWSLQSLTLIAAVSLTFSAYMVISLAANEPTMLLYEATLPSVFVFSIFMTRGMMTYAAEQTMAEGMSKVEIIYSVFAFWTFDPILNKSCSSNYCSPTLTEKRRQAVYVNQIVNFAFRVLLIQAACLVCLAHGSNDVANSIAPLLVELNIN